MDNDHRVEIEAWVNKLATEVMPADYLESFLTLPLGARMFFLAWAAEVGAETEVRDTLLAEAHNI